MIRVWDYFMRRKGILLAIIATFVASGMLSYQALRSSAVEKPVEYIRIDYWGTEEDAIHVANEIDYSDVEVPLTGMTEAPETVPQDIDNILAILDEQPEEPVEQPDEVAEPEPVPEDQVADNSDPESAEEDNSDEAEQGELEENNAEREPIDNDMVETMADADDEDELIISSGTASEEEADGPSITYIICLVVMGVIVATALVYFSEQHFLR